MKKLLLVLTLIVTGLSACKKDENSTRFDDSYKAWQAFKASVNNSYTYTASRQSFTGNDSETQITVVNGKVTKRDYINFEYNAASSSHPRTVLKEWHETQANLNSHPGEGEAVLTLDDVYNKAKNVWLRADKKTNDIYFEANNNGIISSAGYVPKGCADDCFIGITIKAVTAL